MKLLHWLFGVALVAVYTAPVAQTATAAAPASGASVAASPRFQAAAAPDGTSVTFPVDVRNFNERDPLPIGFELGDLDPRGGLVAAHTTSYSLVGLATLPESLVLAPGETKHVSVVVRSDGRTHYGSVIVVAGPPAAPFARIMLKIVLTPPDAAASADIQVRPAPTGDIRVDFRNGGEGVLVGRGVLFLLSPGGQFLGRLDVPAVAVLPHGTASITLQWPENLASGTIARATVTLDGREEPFVAHAAVP